MSKQILIIFLTFVLVQTSLGIPLSKTHDNLISTLNSMATRISDYGNTFNVGFNNIFGPGGAIPLEDLNNLQDNMTKIKLLNSGVINSYMNSLSNQILTNMNNLMASLTTSVVSSMSPISTQIAKNSSLSKLFMDLITSSQQVYSLDPLNTMLDALNTDSQAVVSSGIKTLSVNIEGLIKHVQSIILITIVKLDTINKQFLTLAKNISDPTMVTYVKDITPPLQSTISTITNQMLSIYVNVQVNFTSFMSNSDAIITSAAKQAGSIVGGKAKLIAGNLATSNIKARQCAKGPFFEDLKNLMQNSIIGTANCLLNVSPTIQGLVSSINSTLTNTLQYNIDQYNIAIKCLSKSSEIWVIQGCIQPTIGNMADSVTNIKQAFSILGNQISASLKSLTEAMQSCVGTTITNTDASTQAISIEYTKCVNY